MASPISLALVVFLGALAALSNLAGGALAVLRPALTLRKLPLVLGFSGGFLLSVALVDVVPETLHAIPGYAPWLMLAGYLTVYISEHLFACHVHAGHKEGKGGHSLVGVLPCPPGHLPIHQGAATAATVGLILHSFFDGAAITAALVTDRKLGWLTFMAVVLHKLPEGFSLSSITLASRQTRSRAFQAAIGLAAACFLGSLAAWGAGEMFAGVESVILAFACGMFIHIAATDLLPTTAHVRGSGVLIATTSGMAVALAASLLLARILGRLA